MDLSEKPLFVSSAHNVKFAQKLQSKYSRYDNQELGFNEFNSGSTARQSNKGSVRFDQGRMSTIDKINARKSTVVNSNQEKYTEIYDQLEKGLYDRSSIGKVDQFSKGRR